MSFCLVVRLQFMFKRSDDVDAYDKQKRHLVFRVTTVCPYSLVSFSQDALPYDSWELLMRFTSLSKLERE